MSGDARSDSNRDAADLRGWHLTDFAPLYPGVMALAFTVAGQTVAEARARNEYALAEDVQTGASSDELPSDTLVRRALAAVGLSPDWLVTARATAATLAREALERTGKTDRGDLAATRPRVEFFAMEEAGTDAQLGGILCVVSVPTGRLSAAAAVDLEDAISSRLEAPRENASRLEVVAVVQHASV